MTYCDFCGKPARCVQKMIDGKELDICGACWKPMADRLRGKGRVPGAVEQQDQELEEYDETITY